MMNDIFYIKEEDAERIIAYKKARLERLSDPDIWEMNTRHMEGGEYREFKQSCDDDKIIIKALELMLNIDNGDIVSIVRKNDDVDNNTEDVAHGMWILKSTYKDESGLLCLRYMCSCCWYTSEDTSKTCPNCNACMDIQRDCRRDIDGFDPLHR